MDVEREETEQEGERDHAPEVDRVGDHHRDGGPVRQPGEAIQERGAQRGQSAAGARGHEPERRPDQPVGDRPIALHREQHDEADGGHRREHPRGLAHRARDRVRERQAEKAADHQQHVEQPLEHDARERRAHADAGTPTEQCGPQELAQSERQHGARAEADGRRRERRIELDVADRAKQDAPALRAHVERHQADGDQRHHPPGPRPRDEGPDPLPVRPPRREVETAEGDGDADQ